ncbi:MAG TPA: hypothetical protein VKU85_09430 [bacterium]|nr:hypothetical protein [bacterium]
MPRPSPASAADLCDKYQQRTVIALLAVAGLNAASALEIAFGEPERLFDAIRITLAVSVLLLLLPTMVWKMRNRPGSKRFLRFKEQGYVADVFRRAQGISWMATFILLLLLSNFVEDRNTLPAQFYLETCVAVMLTVFSGVFLFLNRGGDDEREDAHA